VALARWAETRAIAASHAEYRRGFRAMPGKRVLDLYLQSPASAETVFDTAFWLQAKGNLFAGSSGRVAKDSASLEQKLFGSSTRRRNKRRR